MTVLEMANAIISTLDDFVRFNLESEIESDYAEKIKEAYELLVE